jgi:hypothetical protein
MNKSQKIKAELFKDIIMGIIILSISVGCFFTYNPADAPLEVGTGGMTFATYPLAVASLLTILGLIYLLSSFLKYIKNSSKFDLLSNINNAVKNNKSLYFKRLGSVILLVIYARMIGEINFFISSMIFLFTAFYLFERRDYLKMSVLSVLGSGFLYALFIYFLKLPI